MLGVALAAPTPEEAGISDVWQWDPLCAPLLSLPPWSVGSGLSSSPGNANMQIGQGKTRRDKNTGAAQVGVQSGKLLQGAAPCLNLRAGVAVLQ